MLMSNCPMSHIERMKREDLCSSFAIYKKRNVQRKERASNKKITYILSSHQSFFFFFVCIFPFSLLLFLSLSLSSLFRLVYKKENKQKMMYSLSLSLVQLIFVGNIESMYNNQQMKQNKKV